MRPYSPVPGALLSGRPDGYSAPYSGDGPDTDNTRPRFDIESDCRPDGDPVGPPSVPYFLAPVASDPHGGHLRYGARLLDCSRVASLPARVFEACAPLGLAMRLRLAPLTVHVVEALTSVRASLCADRDLNQNQRVLLGPSALRGLPLVGFKSQMSCICGSRTVRRKMRRPGFEPEEDGPLASLAVATSRVQISLAISLLAFARRRNAPTGI